MKKKTPRGEPMRFVMGRALPYEGDDCLCWPYSRNNQGYPEIRIEGKTRLASRYICALAHGDPPTEKHHAAHSCGNGHLGCVNPSHLRWATVSENLMDRVSHGTSNRGSQHPLAKLTEEQVREIIGLRGKLYRREIAAAFGISARTVECIHTGRSWSWMTAKTKHHSTSRRSRQ